MKEIKSPHWFPIDGKWHHCASVCDGKEIKHYVDGEYTHSIAV